MEEKKNTPLKMAEEGPSQKEAPDEIGEKKPAFELPIGYLIAKEMQEIFDEDKVTHRQGNAEPEAD